MMAEVMIGRRGRQSPVNTMRALSLEAGASKLWVGLGFCGVLAGLMILSFYSVIAGWALNYIFATANGAFNNAAGQTVVSYFATLQANPNEMIKWHSIFMFMTLAVVMGGVTQGLGNAVKILMPVLFVLLLVLLAYSYTEGDFGAGFSYLFNFKFDNLTWGGVMIALGHAFFTLSLGMGAIMAYGAYMPGDAPIGKTVMLVAFLDTLIALVAGLTIFPIVFANESIQPGSGPGLLFQTLPVAFGNMPGGVFFGTTFFVLVALAAWSSAISLIEPGVAWLVEIKGFNRVTANLLLGAVAWTLGLGTVYSFNYWSGPEYEFLGFNFFEWVDNLTAQFMLPLGGMLIAIFAGWVMHKTHVRKEMSHESADIFELWHVCVRYLSPILVFAVFLYTLVNFIIS
jgi:NSS family neurotransmitter:Na+ symporter